MNSIIRMLTHARMFRTRAAALIAVLGMVVMSAGLVVVSSSSASATSDVGLCHATESSTNPYNYQTVDGSSSDYQGHLAHRNNPQQVWSKGTWWNNVWHPAGSPKPDLIQGLDPNVSEALCDLSGEVGPRSVTPSVTFTDPTCANDGAIGWAGSDTDKVTYTLRGTVAPGSSVTVTATPQAGYEFPANAATTFPHTFSVSPDCRTGVQPVQPQVSQPHCDSGTVVPGSVATPTDANGIHYSLDSGTVTATIDGATTKWTEPLPIGWVKVDATTATFTPHYGPAPATCSTTVQPTTPDVTEPHCVQGQPGTVAAGTITAPTDADGIDYTLDGDTVTATINGTTDVWGAMPAGWVKVDATTATYTAHYTDPGDCRVAVQLPASLQPVPPTCTTDGSFTLPTGPAHVTWSISKAGVDVTGQPSYGPGTYTVTATADPGYYVGDHLSSVDYTVVVKAASDTSAYCLAIPRNNQPTAASCDSAGSYTVPADGEHYTWHVDGKPVQAGRTYGAGSYVVTAVADEGWHFADDSTTATYQVVVPAQLSGLACYTVVPAPEQPRLTQPDCATNGSLVLPAAPEGVVWVVNEQAQSAGSHSFGPGTYTVVARAVEGSKFADDTTTKSFGSYTVRGATGDCPVFVTAVPPTVTISTHCGVEGSYTIPATAGVQYLLDGSPVAAGTHSGPATGTVTAVGLGSTVLTNPGFSFALVLPPAVQCPPGTTEVTPAAPTFVDPTCAHPDGARAVYADTEAVDYSQTGTVGLGGTVTVTAVPRAGFTFPAGFVASWTHTFPKGVVCATETSKPKPSHTPTVKPTQATGHHHPSRKPTVLGTEAVAVPTAVDAGLATWKGDTSSPTGSLLGESLVAAGLVLLLAGAALGLGRRRRGEHQV